MESQRKVFERVDNETDKFQEFNLPINNLSNSRSFAFLYRNPTILIQRNKVKF